MAGQGAVLSVGNSIVGYLTAVNELARAGGHGVVATFQLVSSAEIAEIATPESGAVVTFWLYHLGIDPQLRNRPFVGRAGAEPSFPLGLELHYLITAWAATAAREQEAIAWVMRELYRHPALDRSTLLPGEIWGGDEVVHLVPTEISNEDMMRIWDAIRPEYRLSVTWCARIVRLDREPVPGSGRPVVATRFAYGRLRETSDGGDA